jgi:hypothetical protein
MDYQLGQRENEKENLASLPGFISKIFQNACVSCVSQRGFPSHPGQKKSTHNAGALPRVHAMVFSPADGILRRLMLG